MSIIVMSVNAGSTSLKFQVFQMPEEIVLASGNIERIGMEDSIFGIKLKGKSEKISKVLPIKDHSVAVEELMNALIEHKIVNSLADIKAVGHRVVHGGEYFSHSVPVDEWSESKVEELCELAPLHNPGALVGLRSLRKALPNAEHCFSFDTAFFQTMPEENFIYPIPYEYYEKDHIRRYGAHGISHEYLTKRLAEIEGKPVDQMNIITCHLGGGASIVAVRNGKAFKVSMGFTPLGGIMMGTRCGYIDPAIVVYLMRKYHYTAEELDTILNKKSGLLGVSGISSDMRDVIEASAQGNPRAILTFSIYVSRVVEQIAGYYGLMGGADAIVFSAGVGENNDIIRQEVCDRLKCMGVKVPADNNFYIRGEEAKLSSDDSKVDVWLIPTNEELVIARDAYKIYTNGK